MRCPVLSALVVCVIASGSRADVVQIVSSRDNTMYSESSNSNGAGPAVFAGNNSGNNRRRGLVYFDVAAAIPAGSTILTARLRLNNTAANLDPALVGVHRALESWGEGTSAAGGAGGGGSGAPPTANDATWVNRFHPGTPWTTAGGVFEAAASASTSVTGAGFFEWTSPGLASDVALYLSTPSSNLGWLLRGDEAVNNSAKRFSSREEPTAGLRPTLIVEFIPAPASALLPGAFLLLAIRRRRSCAMARS